MNQIRQLYQHFLKHQAISTDSRLDVSGTLFFALSGDNFNGNLFAKDAIEKGAALAVVDDEKFATGETFFLVENTLETLQQLAAFHLAQFEGPLLAITGSNGKTTTKELIAAVLQKKYRLCFTRGNLNNHIGVPLTLLQLNKTHEMAVIELGANHVGEIKQLCSIAQPNAGIITNIGKAHIEGFGSFEGVVKAKSELYDFIRENHGEVFVNAEDELLMKLSEGITRHTYGTTVEAGIQASLTSTVPFLKLRWSCGGQEFVCSSRLYGKYNFYNMLAAIAVGVKYRVKPEQINAAIEAFRPSNNRSEHIETHSNHIILDAYNANPVSMREAILSFKDFNSNNPWLILGDMFELGHLATDEHEKIIELLISESFPNVILVGSVFNSLKHLHPYLSFESTSDAHAYLDKNKINDANILIKGSRGMMLEKLLDRL